LNNYYGYLARSVFDFRGQEFWRYHRKRLEELGHPLNNFKLGGTVFLKLPNVLLKPKWIIKRLLKLRRSQPG
jgi:hypothetical protein